MDILALHVARLPLAKAARVAALQLMVVFGRTTVTRDYSAANLKHAMDVVVVSRMLF